LAETQHKMVLSTTEPNNAINLIKIRQGDALTQKFVVEVVENGQLKTFEGLTPFFINTTKFSENQPVEQKVQNFSASQARLIYTLSEPDWQWGGENTAHFSFRSLNGDGTWTEQFSTQDFNYRVISGITRSNIRDSAYVWTFEDLLRMFRDYMNQGKSDWEKWLEDNREILESIDPGGTIINILNEAKGDYNSLADRLDATISIDLDKTVGGYGPQKVRPLNLDNVRSEIDTTKFNLGFTTDLHCEFTADGGSGRKYGHVSFAHIRNIQSLSDKLDCIVYGGDNVDGYYSSKQHALRVNERFAAMIRNQPIPNIPMIGNHDGGMIPNAANGRGPDDSLVSSELSRILGYKDKAYNFMDFPEKKIRLITLDTNDFNEVISNGKYVYHTGKGQGFALREAQLKFLYDALKSAPVDYHVVIMAHAPLSVNGEDKMLNNDLLRRIMNAYKEGTNITIESSEAGHEVSTMTVDFSERGPGILVGYFAGHWHVQATYDSNFICKEVLSDTAGVGSDKPEYVGTETEDSFSVFEIDTEKRTCRTRGIGRTKDDIFSY
jgi:hypothetical protein